MRSKRFYTNGQSRGGTSPTATNTAYNAKASHHLHPKKYIKRGEKGGQHAIR